MSSAGITCCSSLAFLLVVHLIIASFGFLKPLNFIAASYEL